MPLTNDLATLILASGNTKINGTNKCFAKLKNKPIIQYSLDALYGTGIFNATIVCNPKDAQDARKDLDLQGK